MDTKRCKDCGVVKPLTEFSPAALRADGTRRTRIYCKPCSSERAMKYRDQNPGKILDAHLRRKFGITLAQFNAMLAEQGGVCAICGDPPTVEMGIKTARRTEQRSIAPRLFVDHCHRTGRVRGLLCGLCNQGIGYLRDNPDIARFAAKYLEERA